MDVGFIGLGHMGQAMARNLLKAGHRVTAFNRTRGKAEALAKDGAAIADAPADTCRGDAVITILADDPAVEAVVFGPRGILGALGRDRLHISMSTISIALSDRLADAHAKEGQSYIAAPVLGRPEAAVAAKLFILPAGRPALVARAQPLFDAMGQKSFAVGETPSQANLVKLTANFLIASMIECLGEAVALVQKSGIDPTRYIEILTGSLFAAPVYKTYGAMIAERKYEHEPAGFRMKLGLKDVQLALAAANAQAVPMPVASLVHDQFLAGVAQGEGDRDWSGLAGVAARNAGLGAKA